MKMSVLFIAAHEEWGLGAQLVFGINVLMAGGQLLASERRQRRPSGSVGGLER